MSMLNIKMPSSLRGHFKKLKQPHTLVPISQPAWSAVPPHLDVRVHLLEEASGAGDGPAGADAADEDVDLPGGGLPDLRSRRTIVHLCLASVRGQTRSKSERHNEHSSDQVLQ